jgi:hypothetical protein
MRTNVIYSFAAVFVAFAYFTAVFAAFTLPVQAIADQPAGAIATVSATQERSFRGVDEVIVEVRRPL